MSKSPQYEVGQRWRFRTSLQKFENTFVIGAKDDWCDPPEFYVVYIRYKPGSGRKGAQGVRLCLTEEGLRRNATELLETAVRLPEGWIQAQEYSCDDGEIDEVLRDLIAQQRRAEKGRQLRESAVSRKEVLRQLSPWRERHKRLAWQPKTESSDGQITASKFAGRPWLAKGEDWPSCPGCCRPMQLFLQLNLSELPRELEGRYGQGLLQLFYCAFLEGNLEGGDCTADAYQAFKGGKLVRLVQPSGLGQRCKIPSTAGFFPPKTISGWRRKYDYPDSQDHPELGLNYRYDFELDTVEVSCTDPKLKFENQSGDLAEAISTALPGDKLAGWPRWVQGAEYPNCPLCQRRMEVVFQIDYNDNLPWEACGHITQCPEHKEVVTFAWAC